MAGMCIILTKLFEEDYYHHTVIPEETEAEREILNNFPKVK